MSSEFWPEKQSSPGRFLRWNLTSSGSTFYKTILCSSLDTMAPWVLVLQDLGCLFPQFLNLVAIPCTVPFFAANLEPWHHLVWVSAPAILEIRYPFELLSECPPELEPCPLYPSIQWGRDSGLPVILQSDKIHIRIKEIRCPALGFSKGRMLILPAIILRPMGIYIIIGNQWKLLWSDEHFWWRQSSIAIKQFSPLWFVI